MDITKFIEDYWIHQKSETVQKIFVVLKDCNKQLLEIEKRRGRR